MGSRYMTHPDLDGPGAVIPDHPLAVAFFESRGFVMHDVPPELDPESGNGGDAPVRKVDLEEVNGPGFTPPQVDLEEINGPQPPKPIKAPSGDKKKEGVISNG